MPDAEGEGRWREAQMYVSNVKCVQYTEKAHSIFHDLYLVVMEYDNGDETNVEGASLALQLSDKLLVIGRNLSLTTKNKIK